MGLLEKTLGLAGGLAAGGVALAAGLMGNNKKKLAELETEFARTTAYYNAKKSKLEDRIKKGSQQAIKSLRVLERDYYIKKVEYESKIKSLLPKKSKAEEERETKAFEQHLEIEKAKAMHEISMDRTKTVHNLELEKDKNYHQWDLEDVKTEYGLELEKDKNHHEWDMEKAESKHRMEMEKLELTAKLGITPSSDSKKIKDDCRICPNCGNKNTEGFKFCGECGIALNVKRFCTECGATLEGNPKFCPMCGTEIN